MQATAKDLRIHSKGLLEAVEKGENVVITFRGKPCARLVPYQNNEKSTEPETNDLFGIWADRVDMGSVEDYLPFLRKGRFLMLAVC
jgi:prevent-host-death family protein